MEALSKSMIDAASGSVELALGLVGVMTLFLGLMKVAEAGGLLVIIAKVIRPLMTRLFPEVPPNHPAMGAMILNMSANALGLGNAATPFGIRASAGSADPAAILPTTLFATICATIAAISAAFLYKRFFPVGPLDPNAAPLDRPWVEAESDQLPDDGGGYPLWVSALALGGL